MKVSNFPMRMDEVFRWPTFARLKAHVLATSVSVGLASVSFGQENGEDFVEQALAETPTREETGPLFVELDPKATGMADFTNDYQSPRIWGDHWRTYLFGAIGTGVAVGDVDGDGRPDIFAVSKNEQSRLYRNLGDFRFEDITEQSGIDDSGIAQMDKNETPGGGAAFADVNNDGALDLYLCFLGAPNQLWINDGTGRFEERAAEWSVDVSTASVMGYFADYDGDGFLDLYVATNLLQVGDDYPGPKPDLLFRNTGSRFVEVTEQAGISGEGHAHAAVWWDFDNDRKLDLYVANDFAGMDRLYRNKGNGEFEDVVGQSVPRMPYYAMGADFGDLNGDGRDDFWVADMAPTSRSRYKQTLESHRHVYEDGRIEAPHQYMQNVLLLNLNGKRFADVAALAGLHRTDWTWAARLADFDNDGLLDAFATNGMLRNFNDGDLGMRLSGQNNLVHYAQIFKPTPVLEERNLAFQNKGQWEFQPAGERWGLDKMGVSFGAAMGDLDGDGALDLVLSNFREPPSVYRSFETEGARVIVELQGRESNRFGIGARVELWANGEQQSRTLVPHRGYMSSDEPILHFGLGQAQRIDKLEVHWPSGRRQTLSNLAVNRRYLIREAGPLAEEDAKPKPRFSKLNAQFPERAARKSPEAREFSRQSLLPFALERFTSAATSGDFNGDGKSDLFLGGASGQSASVLLAGEAFVFNESWSLDIDEDFPSADSGFALTDFNQDGDVDLIAVSGGASLDEGDLAYQDRMYWGSGDGQFRRDFNVGLSQSAVPTGAVAEADFDADGLVDLFVAGGYVPGRYPESVESVLWRNLGEGVFKRVDAEVATGLANEDRVAAAAWADLERDGYPDLVVAKEWGQIELWRNMKGVLSRVADAFGGKEFSGVWSSLEVGDFDGDGRLDVAAGNLGMNAGGLWMPSLGPRRLWWKSTSRGVQLIETHVEEGVEWPFAWKDRMAEERALRRFASIGYSAFSEKNARELFGDLEQSGFQRLELNEPRSGIFWQQDDGGFVFGAFPPYGQTGRIVDLLSADFDQDGIIDLVASIEPGSLAPWTGRSETGHMGLFLGDSNRRIVAELPGESGLDIGLRSPRKALWSDYDGDGKSELLLVFLQGAPLLFGQTSTE